MFSKACEYGIRATIFIANASTEGRKVSIPEIAEATNAPAPFTAKVLQQLVKKQIVSSLKGPTGGFFVEPETLQSLQLKSLVEAIDGNDLFVGCGLGLPSCNANKPCPIHHQFKEVRDRLNALLSTTTLQDLVNNLHSGHAYLKL